VRQPKLRSVEGGVRPPLPDKEPGVVAASVYSGGRRVTDIAIEEAQAWAKKKGHVVWIRLHEPDMELLERVATQLHLHPLAIEDASKAHQQPKVEQSGDALFIVGARPRWMTATSPSGRPSDDRAGWEPCRKCSSKIHRRRC
jgi:magnesium transporter